MNAKLKKRMIVVSGIIVVVLILVLAFVGGNTAAQTVKVGDVVGNSSFAGQKVQVSGNVVPGSFSTVDDVLTFSIYDPDAGETDQLVVRYDGAASSTFGNDVTAICTGRIGDDGTLSASELVTKCPSKYENAEEALTISQLLGYGDSVLDKPVKVAGAIKAGTLAPAGQGERMVIVDGESGDELAIVYEGALSDEAVEGATVVLTGSIGGDGRFTATDVALEG